MIIVVKCGDPGTPTNGRQIVNKGYVYRGSVTFVCDTNYTLKGISLIFCKADKGWTASVPQCLGNCNRPFASCSILLKRKLRTATSKTKQLHLVTLNIFFLLDIPVRSSLSCKVDFVPCDR